MSEAPSVGRVRKPASLREAVIQSLRAAIISGEMAPGQVYSAPTLAVRLGVSPTPVREAMVELSREGLVETMPNKGFRVTSVTETELDEIAELRRLVEGETVRRVAPLIPEDAVPELRRLAQDIVDRAEGGDLIAYTEADQLFHQTILEYGGNRRLITLVSDLRAHTRLYGLAEMAQEGTLATSAAEHLALVDLIAARDGDGAGELMNRHIGRSRAEWAKPTT
jgi:DNA-binding GntR family transcriptional regulator